MMALDFPMSPPPANGQIFTAPGGTVWSWNGTAWVVGAGSSGAYLPLVGGTLTGRLDAQDISINNQHSLFVQQQSSGTGSYLTLKDDGNSHIETSGTALWLNSWNHGGVNIGGVTNIYKPGVGDPLSMNVDNGNNCRIYMTVNSNRQWVIGVENYNGRFSLVDVSGNDWRWYIDAGGSFNFNHDVIFNNGNQLLNGGIIYLQNSIQWSIANDTNSLCFRVNGGNKFYFDNSGNNLYSTGNLVAGGHVVANGTLYCGGWGGPYWYNSSGYMYTDQTVRCHGILPRWDNESSSGLSGNAWAQVASYWFNTVSDGSLKQHVRTPKADALDKVLKLLPIEYHWTEGETEDMPHHRGFLAQDVRDVMGDDYAGWREENGVQGISYDELTAVLWQAVQELAAEVAGLKRHR